MASMVATTVTRLMPAAAGFAPGLAVPAPPSTLAANTCNVAGNDAIPTYFAAATPNAVGSTGQRSFGTDQRATVYQDSLGAAFDANAS